MSQLETLTAFRELERAATEVHRRGAIIGGHWVQLATALICARGVLSRAGEKPSEGQEWHQLYQHEFDRREKLEHELAEKDAHLEREISMANEFGRRAQRAEKEVELYRSQLHDATVRLAEAQAASPCICAAEGKRWCDRGVGCLRRIRYGKQT